MPYDEAYEEGFEDMHRRVPCTEKVSALIGWRARKTLDEILRGVIEFQRAESPLEPPVVELA